MKPLTTFAHFWYDFIVGDDWRIAAGCVATITVVAVAGAHDINVWWVLPVMVAALLAASVNLAARTKRGSGASPAGGTPSPACCATSRHPCISTPPRRARRPQ